MDPVEEQSLAASTTYALFVGTDFTKAELSVVKLAPDSVAGRLPIADQDSVAAANRGYGFVLERAQGKAIVLDGTKPWTASRTLDVNDSPDAGSYASNPRTVVVTAGTKSYVARYATNTVKIIDVATGAASGNIDLSAFLAPGDPDGKVEVQDAVYNPSTGRAYFLLERIDQFDFGPAPDYVGKCLGWRGQIVTVNVATNTVVGAAIDLLGDNPQTVTADFAANRLIVVDTGCRDGNVRRGRGIESVSLANGAKTWLYQTADQDRLSALVWADATHAFVNKGSSWYAWNPTQTALGSALANFPQAPVYDGAGRVVGLQSQGSGGSTTWSVVAWNVATSQLSTIVTHPFQSVVPASPYGVTSALLVR
ncbi:glutaminyl-peptide cyclotransferase [Pendulispora rubella]|uniref:Glutaminyl-peptide cyclotransferase n=1 Tax=Pendulispora rubella TaxID=2741070 RepID=A0ABZ2L2N0_9BACT